MICDRKKVEALFATNQSMNSVPSIGQKSFAECVKDWERIKAILANTIVKRMEEIEVAEGNDYAMNVWAMVSGQIATTNWQRPCGMFPIWNSIFSKAKGAVKKQMTGISEISTLSQGLLKREKHQVSNRR